MKSVLAKYFFLFILSAIVLICNRICAMTIDLETGGVEFIEPNDHWMFFRGDQPPSNPADYWKDLNFDDTGWESGPSGFGYGDGDDNTIINDMQGNYLTVYIRKQFVVPSLPADQSVELVIDYDDGFIAYIDTEVVKRMHMPDGDVTYETPATEHEAGTPEILPLGTVGDLSLAPGIHVMAIEGHNHTMGSTDFSLNPTLRTSANIVQNGNTWIVDTAEVTLTGSTSAANTESVRVQGTEADFNPGDGTWSVTVTLESGMNHVLAEALDTGFQVVDSGTIDIVYVPPANRFSGDLPENTTWSDAVVVEETVTVPIGIVLTIEPGTQVFLKSGVSLIVNGQLLAHGTEAEPIYFTRYGDGTRWERILFIEAADSRLENCYIEFADCEGDHLLYYDDDCNPETPLASRTYHEAVVVVASHVDIESCVFQNLPDDGAEGEGDALAVISDDPDYEGEASATIRNCEFLSIGQGVHTRFSYVLVENCFFTGHYGDNDDVDLYGESMPPPMIRNNLFLNPVYDDMINPTKCSAVMIGNFIIGSGDHGVVLRDKCYPVMINNVIANCSSGGIAVQNQCDALLINNTIFNCGKGIRFFDHTSRWGPPYCLHPGSGKAKIINCIIWDCSTSLHLTDSPYEDDPGSHATVLYCNIEGGLGSTSVSTDSTLTWGAGNFDSDPKFVATGSDDFHLKSEAGHWDSNTQTWIVDGDTSPCIDAGISYDIDDPNYSYSAVIDWRGELWPHGMKINLGAYGGTTQASMSEDDSKGCVADLNFDGRVNILDFQLLAQKWMFVQHLLKEDMDRNNQVGIHDAAILFEHWLWEEATGP